STREATPGIYACGVVGGGRCASEEGRRRGTTTRSSPASPRLTRVEELLLTDRGGLAAAGRLSQAQDAVIRTLYDFAVTHVYPATNPSTAEHM
ncbi:hypothetical protein KC217_20435, partial [Mycobacterium tuberculosis]|nr:hypothetical protein [Mycobacterium tuberculosis]